MEWKLNEAKSKEIEMDIQKLKGLVELLEVLNGEAAEADVSGMVGKYVIVRCRDAGVHAGKLESHSGRGCTLAESRRLWYWKPANGAAFLSGIAAEGLDDSSKLGSEVRIHLTENCEIIECSSQAEESIRGLKSYET